MTEGYVVTNSTGHLLEEQEGVLWIGDHATLFPTYDTARCASRRTLRFAIRKGYVWGRDHRIIRVVGRKPQ